MHYNWDIARDINIFQENVIPYLRNPIRRGGNPAATPSALADWGYLVTDNNNDELTPLGVATRDIEISWSDSVLLALSKRNASWQQSTIKPIVVLAKYITQLIIQKHQNIYITKADLTKLMHIEDYDEISSAFCDRVLQSVDRFQNPSSREYKYHDIWFNALGETPLFFSKKENNVTIMCFNHSAYTEAFIQEIARLGPSISICPPKSNRAEYYLYQGSITNGIMEILPEFNDLANASHICPTLCALCKNEMTHSADNPIVRKKPILVGNNTIQQIYYGCPGSGKSHHVKDITEHVDSNFVFRTTFHPDTDYASFVGCYKPIAEGHNGNYRFKSLQDLKAEANIINSSSGDKVSQIVAFVTKYANDLQYIVDTDPNIKSLQNLLNKNLSFANETYLAYVVDYVLKNQETRITYKFCPQVFTNAYIKAWEDTCKPVYLIIEEINRGNCAQIFGDLFQLLDRDKATGKSEYPIKADKDLVAHIEKVLGAGHEGIKNGELCLPPNLIIYATMNTSDQSLFPMDSAFKRRWDWEYVPIEYGQKKSNNEDNDSYNFIIKIGGNKYKWIKFLRKVNDKIYGTTLSEDKQMGNYFIKGDVDELQFVNKVMFYLWNEVCKEEYKTLRNFFRKGKAKDNEECQEFKFVDLFTAEEGKNIEQTRVDILTQFMAHLEVTPEPEPKGENSEPKNNEQPAEQ